MLKTQLAQAQNRMKQQANKLRTDRVFQVGEQVLLRLQPYAQSSVVNRPFPKLSFKFFGPYTILERIGGEAYRLDLPAGSRVHNVFHVSQLKPFLPDHTPHYSDIQKLVDLSAHSTVPVKILERRLVKHSNTTIPQVLFQWSGFSPASATWEDFYVVQKQFPEAITWGQASSQGGKMSRLGRDASSR